MSECEDDSVVKMKLLLSRTSGLNCSTDRKLQAVNATESATTGLGVRPALGFFLTQNEFFHCCDVLYCRMCYQLLCVCC